MRYRTLTDDELRACITVEPSNIGLRDEIVQRFERDLLGDGLRRRIAEQTEEIADLEKEIADLKGQQGL